jgi:predicted MFS family arabinose efflux permease
VFRFLTLRTRYVLVSVLFVLGTLMTIAARDILWMSLARFVAGLGFGGALLATTSLVKTMTDDRRLSSGFGIAAAGFAAATLCSVPIGGVVVSRLGSDAGLYTAAVFGVLFLVFILVFLKVEPEAEQKPHHKLTWKQWGRILASRHILTYTLFMNIPFQVLYWGLLQYVLPLYMTNTMGFSEANIGRILSLFCIISLFAAYVSRFADKLMNDKLMLAIGSLVVGFALLLFNILPAGGLMLFIGVIVAMGIQNLFVDSIEEVYVTKGRVPVDVDEETLLQSYKTVEKVLSIFVPTLSGILFLLVGFGNAMFVIGAVTLVGAVLFLLFARNGRTKTASQGATK